MVNVNVLILKIYKFILADHTLHISAVRKICKKSHKSKQSKVNLCSLSYLTSIAIIFLYVFHFSHTTLKIFPQFIIPSSLYQYYIEGEFQELLTSYLTIGVIYLIQVNYFQFFFSHVNTKFSLYHLIKYRT